MQKFYSKFAFDCSLYLKQYCIDFLTDNWDFRTEKIFRMDRSVTELDILHRELEARNLPKLVYMSVFCRGPFSKQPIHIDTCYNNGNYEKSNSNFYIPIFNQHGKLVWFNALQGIESFKYTPAEKNSNNTASPVLSVSYRDDVSTVINEYKESDPVIINTLIPHRAESGNSFRAALSMRLEGNPDLFSLLGV